MLLTETCYYYHVPTINQRLKVFFLIKSNGCIHGCIKNCLLSKQKYTCINIFFFFLLYYCSLTYTIFISKQLTMFSIPHPNHLFFLPECRIIKNSDQIFFSLYISFCLLMKSREVSNNITTNYSWCY